MKLKAKIFGVILFTIAIIGFFIIWKIQFNKIPVEEAFPGKPWIRVIDNLPELEGVGVPRAENCGRCHAEIYKEWKASTHAHALSDLQFQAELTKDSSPKWLCLNCHIPIANQREELVTHLIGGDYRKPVFEKNTKFDLVMQREAVTCATCHVRMDDSGKAYVLGANGNTEPAHPVKIDATALNGICANCHQAHYQLSDQLVCSFGTVEEMKEWQAMDKVNEKENCASCHLPFVQRSFVIHELKKPVRKSHQHGFIGGAVPKEFPLYGKQLELGYKPGIELLKIEKQGDGVKISIQNKNAGHYVPSGDPERFLLLQLEVINKAGQLILSREMEIGQEWEWSPKARKLEDHRLKPGEIRIWEERELQLEEGETFVFRIIHVRMRDEVAAYVRQSAERIDSSLKNKIKDLDNHYPRKSTILESKVHIPTWKRIDTHIQDLMKRNSKNL